MVVLGNDYSGQDCGLARSLEIVGERWTLLIVRDAFYGVQRFNDFQARLEVPRAVLSARLRALVDHGVLERVPDPEHGGRSLYRLTERGRALWPAVHGLISWGSPEDPPPRTHRHERCGTELAAGGVCPACGGTPPPHEVVTERSDPSRGRDDRVSVRLREPRRLLEPLS
jgi:DNA-binding HxlR family transcriptional regulator